MKGYLSVDHIEPARPFSVVVVNFLTRMYKTNEKQPQKAYVAVFCCFSTKAVPFEIVANLTTDAFIGAFKRFMRIVTLATNFGRARNQLKELENVIYSKPAFKRVTETCNTKLFFIQNCSHYFKRQWYDKHNTNGTCNTKHMEHQRKQRLIIFEKKNSFNEAKLGSTQKLCDQIIQITIFYGGNSSIYSLKQYKVKIDQLSNNVLPPTNQHQKGIITTFKAF